jgi:choline dehydrogenase-like flavoprotein
VEADVVIVGSGAGGGVTADILSDAGLRVVLVEEGPLKLVERLQDARGRRLPELYQESAARKTKDKAINILQGRCVGGSTTVNWTSSFRTPPPQSSTSGSASSAAATERRGDEPWFAVMEHKLWVRAWDTPPNENNKVLAKPVPKSWASRSAPSSATSRAAGTSATAAWVARPTPSSRCC